MPKCIVSVLPRCACVRVARTRALTSVSSRGESLSGVSVRGMAVGDGSPCSCGGHVNSLVSHASSFPFPRIRFFFPRTNVPATRTSSPSEQYDSLWLLVELLVITSYY